MNSSEIHAGVLSPQITQFINDAPCSLRASLESAMSCLCVGAWQRSKAIALFWCSPLDLPLWRVTTLATPCQLLISIGLNVQNRALLADWGWENPPSPAFDRDTGRTMHINQRFAICVIFLKLNNQQICSSGAHLCFDFVLLNGSNVGLNINRGCEIGFFNSIGCGIKNESGSTGIE